MSKEQIVIFCINIKNKKQIKQIHHESLLAFLQNGLWWSKKLDAFLSEDTTWTSFVSDHHLFWLGMQQTK